MSATRLSVLFATRNSARVFQRTLERYLALRQPAVGWELMVIDNGSTDDTAAILERYRSRLRLLVMSEPRPERTVRTTLVLRRDEKAGPAVRTLRYDASSSSFESSRLVCDRLWGRARNEGAPVPRIALGKCLSAAITIASKHPQGCAGKKPVRTRRLG